MIMNGLDHGKYDAFAVDTACIGHGLRGTQETALPGNTSGCGDKSTDLELLPLDHIVSPDGSRATPDVVLIALHGRFGEDGTVQGLLELLEIPYVGSGVLASALAMNKIVARKVLEYEGLPVPKGLAVSRGAALDAVRSQVADSIGYPAVVKPNEQGSTIGISIVRSADELAEALKLAFEYDDRVLIEEFVEGIEITCGILGNDDPVALPLVEIVPEGGFYDYHAKYTPGATDEIVPARISEAQTKEAQGLALACHKALCCRGMSRVDMIVSGDRICVLEVNTIPGMTPTSLLPRAAEAAGISFARLLDTLIGFALEGKSQ